MEIFNKPEHSVIVQYDIFHDYMEEDLEKMRNSPLVKQLREERERLEQLAFDTILNSIK